MIYLLEDDANIREFVLYALTGQDMEAQGFERPSAFFAAMEQQKPDLVLLDVMLPEEDDDTETVQVVTTVRCDPLKGRISKESPMGKELLGRRLGDRFLVTVNDSYSYWAVIRSITKSEDDGTAPIL